MRYHHYTSTFTGYPGSLEHHAWIREQDQRRAAAEEGWRAMRAARGGPGDDAEERGARRVDGFPAFPSFPQGKGGVYRRVVLQG